MAQSEIITLNQLKDSLGVPYSDTTKDLKLEQAISSATSAIRTYLDRDFGTSIITEEREFVYDGSGILEMDDCALNSITSVKIADRQVSTREFLAQPTRRSPVHYWMVLAPSYGISPAMGFTWNLDTYYLYANPITYTLRVKVTADWGWPQIPDDIQQAAIYTAAAMAESPKPYVSQQYQSYSVQLPNPMTDAIPARAVALLAPYQRIRL
ncbi:gp6 domain containing protein [uncultured Caudovirales phage]|uniref:Gp6 domain containing protein n=1 Tax=uncultured Caudovirales phage TaxID=2100421 RepID=A0A6J7XK28_9CAUD|nr:gp6 domain containing protein [uncultured Caudovirales phage]CAB4199435.1 gp6 domain containing protein [uncultured Caudovirales phage]CAB5228286.1 gp6 domain containing protein [uncultured Caudovirales phage]